MKTTPEGQIEQLVEEAYQADGPAPGDVIERMEVGTEEFSRMARALGLSEEALHAIFETRMD